MRYPVQASPLRHILFLAFFVVLFLFGPDPTHNAFATTNPDALYQREFSLFRGLSQSNETIEWGYEGAGFSIGELENRVAYTGAGLIFWPEGRYLDRENPFFFVPLNYRNPYWHLSAVHSPISDGADLFLGSLVAREYSNIFYLGGSARYLGHFEPGSPHSLAESYSLEGGIHNPLVEAGIRFHSLRGQGRVLSEDLLGTASALITPSPFFLIKLKSSWYFQGKELGDRASDSGEFIYVNSAYWWQIGAGVTRSRPGDDQSVWTTQCHVGKHLRNLFIKGAYQFEDKGDSPDFGKRSGLSASLQFRLDPFTLLEAAYSRTEYDEEESGPDSSRYLRHLYLGISRLF